MPYRARALASTALPLALPVGIIVRPPRPGCAVQAQRTIRPHGPLRRRSWPRLPGCAGSPARPVRRRCPPRALAAASDSDFSRASHSAMIFCFCSSRAASRAERSSPGLLAFAALGGIHLQNGLHQVVDIFHAMHLTLWELYLGWVPCLPLRGGQGAFLYINRYTQLSGSAVL